MKINIKRLENNFHMEAVNEDGNTIHMDGSPDIGGEGKGMRPMQLLLVALGGCSSIDVLMILKKQKQNVEAFEVEVESDKVKVEDHSIYKNIVLHYKITGQVDREKAERAINLSHDKYCSVSKTLEPQSHITHRLTINGVEG